MNILCATDFSGPALAAADVAACLAKKLNLPLHLVHCGPEWIVAGDIPLPAPVDESLKSRLDAEAKRLASDGLEISTEYVQGGASWEVAQVAANHGSKLIVLGSTGLGRAERWLIGSVAERVAQSAPAPTLVVREPDKLLSWLQDKDPLLIMCAADSTQTTDAALSAVREMSTLGKVVIEVAHIDNGPYNDIADHEGTRLEGKSEIWEQVHRVLGGLPVKVCVWGNGLSMAANFARIANDRGAGLVVVGTHQRHGWQRLKNPSFSRGTLADATGNVLCVPSGAYRLVRRKKDIRRVLLAMDFGPASDAAFRHSLSLLPEGGDLHVIHLCKDLSAIIKTTLAPRLFVDSHSAARKDVEEAARQLTVETARQEVPGNIHVSTGAQCSENVAEDICEAADTFGADVICMGSSSRSRIGTALLGSTVQSVMSLTHKPLLIVHPDEK